LTIAKFLALAGIIGMGLLSKKGDISHFYPAPTAADGPTLSLLGLALIPILWTYGGWHENTFLAGETKNAAKTLPFALVAGIVSVTAIYLAMNAVYLYLFPAEKIADSKLIGSDTLHLLAGAHGQKILEAVIITSALGALNAMIMTGSRITYAMAKDNRLFHWLGQVHARYGTPVRAIVINSAWTIALVLLGSFNELLFFTGLSVWLFFALAVSGIFILRRKFPDTERPCRVWGYPATPILFILVCAALSVNTIVYSPMESLIGLGLTLSGLGVFFISQKCTQNRCSQKGEIK